jgi:hypothetical protein
LAQVKRDAANRNIAFKLADIEWLMGDAINRVTAEDCKKYVRHIERLQEENFAK